jgi:CubicO group peptidase (beta-lactamase class C family)
MRLRLASSLLWLPLAGCNIADNPAQERRQSAIATRGLDPAAMAAVVKQARTLPRLRALLVMRHGETLAEHRFNGGPPLDRPVNVKSASKTLLSALAGIAIERGVLKGVDQPILSVLRADAPVPSDPRLERVTVSHLLSMRAGLERTSGAYYGRWVSSPNWVRYALSRPFVDEPGGNMLYSTGSSHLLSAMLTRASGRSTHALAEAWLAEPLGVRIAPWSRDPQGIFFGGNDMLLSPRALAAFGEMYRNGGRHRGRQIVPEAWVRESWIARATSPWSGNGYGYGWFNAAAGGHPIHFAWGYGGQMLYIVPELALTVVMTSDAASARDNGHIQALHRLLGEGIVPAAERGGEVSRAAVAAPSSAARAPRP